MVCGSRPVKLPTWPIGQPWPATSAAALAARWVIRELFKTVTGTLATVAALLVGDGAGADRRGLRLGAAAAELVGDGRVRWCRELGDGEEPELVRALGVSPELVVASGLPPITRSAVISRTTAAKATTGPTTGLTRRPSEGADP